MSKNTNKVWLGTDQLASSAEYLKATDNEVGAPVSDNLENPRLESSRRDFLKYLGFGMTAATIASCDIPVRKAIPYVTKPDTIVPGVATYFASTFAQSGDYVPILVKTREGRPIKIEGNGMSKLTQGGTTARVQASILGLYDTSRFDGPYRIVDGITKMKRNATDNDGWDVIDAEIVGKLSANAQVRILSHTLMSPSTLAAITEFKATYPNTELVQYDPVSSAAMLDANQATFGKRAIPKYHFDRAETIVSFGADFLGTWISPVQYARDYVQGRKTNAAKMSRHVQVESGMSLTGSNADNRIMVKPSEQGQAILALYNAVVGDGGNASLSGTAGDKLAAVGAELNRNRGRSLVISSSNNLAEQLLVNAINEKLGSYGTTITTDKWSMQRKGDDKAIARFAQELEADRIDAVFVLEGANPAYDNPWGKTIAENLSKADVAVSLSGVPNDTSVLCSYVAPDHHFLESWGDIEAVEGELSLIQPTITPIFESVGRAGTRQAGESFLTWAKSAKYQIDAEQPYLEFVKATWEATAFARQGNFTTFQAFWDSALHDGVISLSASAAPSDAALTMRSDTSSVLLPAAVQFNGGAVAGAGARVNQAATGQEVSFGETVNVGNGIYANNPWLQECPDPITRTVWGNYLAIPVKWEGGYEYTAYNDLNEEEYKGKADIVSLRPGGEFAPADVTVVRQFGQLENTFVLAVGYGRKVTGMSGRAIGHDIGVNVYPWLPVVDGYVQYYITGAEVSGVVDNEEEFASVQYHHTMGLTTKSESGAMLYHDRRNGENIELDRALTEEEKEYLEPYHVDEATVMNGVGGSVGDLQGGLTKRSIIFQGTFAELPELQEEILERRTEAQHLNEQTLYPYEEYAENIYSQGHWWAMHVDLTACIGCAACEVACVAENNVPVVGKYEVWRHHEMKWLRIDRYFYGDVENPRAVYQPMMCQHCDNAPCENVCPVNASQHSDEGLNQMIYNRCIGTRYCANNCPYKVRRFNWLDFTTGDLFSSNEPSLQDEELAFGADNLTRMVLNPDVTVRSRGVIEKCSFCAQRLQAGKLTAKVEKRQLRDSDVRTACQTACPTGAITFGDRNNKQGEVAKKLNNPLNYLALEEVNTQSAVFYAARVHNPMEELA
ncbi:TAT-variant-translocated molybdopterin oxidoreductase [Neolewinella antarctica]|uniref:Molybdopterin-containing oxidoreductase family iron-sulfur binding subunit n=1 Tax=Neolewinella antarctica TaxID=442734 RepID=A0ABX0X7I2_9BACT|nr:TAT-variant-translocated molybdopterin oxidoreductase [Neolewinella antarctica]NJC25178.1 molybdopterin-containing oxidoreductase family iron-sulfur binding subunit [Neolewinella antarctica]